MAQFNPDPHARGYKFIPTLRVTAFLDTHEQLRQSLRALRAAGVEGKDIDVYIGQEGAHQLDLSGDEHGVGVQVWRALEFMFSDQTALHEQANEHLKTGGILIAVRVGDDEARKDAVVEALKALQARGVNYWDRWTVDQLA
jgi:hypothetical protein